MHALGAAALVFAGPESVSECLERAESMSGVLGSDGVAPAPAQYTVIFWPTGFT